MKLEVGKTYTLKSDNTARAKVIAEVSSESTPKRYWVEISEKNFHVPWCGEYLGSGIHVAGYTKYDLMEIPPEPHKVVRWIHMFTDASNQINIGVSNNKEITTYGSVRLIGRKKITIVEGEFDE